MPSPVPSGRWIHPQTAASLSSCASSLMSGRLMLRRGAGPLAPDPLVAAGAMTALCRAASARGLPLPSLAQPRSGRRVIATVEEAAVAAPSTARASVPVRRRSRSHVGQGRSPASAYATSYEAMAHAIAYPGQRPARSRHRRQRPSMAPSCSQSDITATSMCRPSPRATVDGASLFAIGVPGGMDVPPLFSCTVRLAARAREIHRNGLSQSDQPGDCGAPTYFASQSHSGMSRCQSRLIRSSTERPARSGPAGQSLLAVSDRYRSNSIRG